jgi:hypothetical protein
MDTKKEQEKEMEEGTWIPLDEVTDYLRKISEGLQRISEGIKESLEKIAANVKEQGENNDGN